MESRSLQVVETVAGKHPRDLPIEKRIQQARYSIVLYSQATGSITAEFGGTINSVDEKEKMILEISILQIFIKNTLSFVPAVIEYYMIFENPLASLLKLLR